MSSLRTVRLALRNARARPWFASLCHGLHRDVYDGAFWGCSGGQWAGRASSGRPPELGIYRMYPYHVPRGAGPVTGGSRGRRDGLADPGHESHDQGGKRVNN